MRRILARGSMLTRLLANPMTVAALIFLGVVIAMALLAPVLAPFDPDKTNLTALFLPVGTPGHLLGTDELGRDQLSRVIFGARISLVAVSIAVVVAVGLGVPLGIVAGYFGGRIDTVASRVIDALMSVPALILALTIIAVLGRGLVNSMVAIGIVIAPRFFRLSRAIASELRKEAFVEALIALGSPTSRILVRHVLPNALSPIMVQVALTSGMALIAEATLSFLGAGVRPPVASWGSMIGFAYNQIYVAPYLAYAPGFCIALTVLAFMIVGEDLRKVLVARHRGPAENSGGGA